MGYSYGLAAIGGGEDDAVQQTRGMGVGGGLACRDGIIVGLGYGGRCRKEKRNEGVFHKKKWT